ncbi:MAG: DUF5618 family protein [bacterium]
MAKKEKLTIPKTPEEAFEEAYKLYKNAKEILARSQIEYGIYKDAKCVKEACGLGYLAPLKAIDGYLLSIGAPDKLPTSIIEIERALQKIPRNGKLMAAMTVVYQNLHILGYYRGGIGVEMIKEGFKSAKLIIDTLSKIKSKENLLPFSKKI